MSVKCKSPALEVVRREWMVGMMMGQDLERSNVGEVLGWALPSTEEFLTLPVEELLSRLKTSLNGLSSEEVERRLEVFGYNELVRRKRRAIVIDFLSHFKSPLIIILLIAGLVSGFFGEVINATIIFVIVTFSVVLDFYQESKAERAAEMLK
ncbi:MAG: cation-transporting P-type ATPase, partial [Candidatus Bathyarchaeia archaeon]